VVNAALQGAQRKEKLSIFSGHDTVIAPVLAGLGVYSGDLCIWPGYASNIVVELWQPKSARDRSAATANSEARPSPSLQKLFPGKWESVKPSPSSSYAESFVRVIFNGEDVTQRIPTCAAERALTASAQLLKAASQGLTLCSLDALVSQVASLIGGYATIEEACKA
jgi:hypothetical protein